MSNLRIKTTQDINLVLSRYPESVRNKLLYLRKLILETADEIETINDIEETLKWGEPSYLAKKGSTIRIDWKEDKPNQYAMYFKCTSKLVPTFKTVYSHDFKFEGNRAIIFQMNDKIPQKKLKKCISVGLTYHKVKHLPLLGL